MKILIFNTGQILYFADGYRIDGVLQPLGLIQEGVYHLDYILTEKPTFDEVTQYVTDEFETDLVNNVYKQVWTVHNRSDEQITEYLTQQGEAAIQTVKNELIEAQATQIYNANIETISELDDETALTIPYQFPPFNPNGHGYLPGDRFYYTVNQKLYKVLQSHTSQPDWLPTTALSLYVEVSPPGVIPVWVQPTGAHDAYNIGDQVHFPTADDPVYESLINANVWSPTAYPAGWQQI